MMNDVKIRTFQDLNAWQEAHKLAIMVYKFSKKLPSSEKFGINSQITRAAVSVSSNIAEGFSRDTYSDKCHFYVMAHGSLTEVQNLLILSKDLEFIGLAGFNEVFDQTQLTYKILAGLIRSTKEKK